MAMWERHTQKLCPKGPSFSSSLLDAIYRSIDETRGVNTAHRRNTATKVEDDIESLRRAIVIEKWIESLSTNPHHFPSNSASSTDSSVFSSTETESSTSRTSPKTSLQKHKTKILQLETQPKRDGKFTKTKSRAQKICGDLKKVKEPISPGGKISNFFNSIFSPRNLKSTRHCVDDDWSSMRKSRSMKDTTMTCSTASRSCLTKNASSRASKSKRSVRFCPVDVIVDEDKAVCTDEFAKPAAVGSQFIKRNIESFRVFEGKSVRKYELRDCYHSERDLDDMSCASSDLFELENIGRVEVGAYEEDLPVYETTSLEMNQSIGGGGMVMY